MPLPTLGQMIAALGSPVEWTAIDPSKLLWDNVNSILYINGEPVYTGTPASGESFFNYGAKEFHFYNEGDEVGRINDGTGENVGFGPSALSAITPSGSYGRWNTAVGFEALKVITSGRDNVAIGAYALTNSSGNCEDNIAIGSEAMEMSVSGDENVAIGYCAMQSGEHWGDVAIGVYCLAGWGDAPGDTDYNVAIGYGAMEDFDSGSCNIAIGEYALEYGEGEDNIAIGTIAMESLRGYTEYNIAIGYEALWGYHEPDDYNENIAIGFNSMCFGDACAHNVSIGVNAMYENFNGELNAVLGYNSLADAVSPDCNTALGAYAGGDSVVNSYNSYLGYDTSVQKITKTIPVAKHNHVITPSPGLIYHYWVLYGYSFVFDDGTESNLVIDDLYGDIDDYAHPEKTYRIDITNVPVYTTTDGPKVCVARKIYRQNDRCLTGVSWASLYYRFYLVGTLNDNSTVYFEDSMTEETLVTQPVYVGASGSIAFGTKAQITNNQQMVVGGSGSIGQIKEAYFGNGVWNATPIDFTLNPTGGYGSNKAGANLILAGGRSTGTANGGSIKFQVTPASGESTAHWNPLVDALTIDSAKVVREYNDTTGVHTPLLGTNCPVSGETPYTWWKIRTSDNSVGYIPVWR